MAQYLGAGNYMRQLRKGTTSPHRPPHLNETVCGCRCGCGCRTLDEEGDNITSDSETLVDDTIEEQSLTPPDSEYHTDDESVLLSPRMHPLESIPLREFLFGNNILLAGTGGGQEEEGSAGTLSFRSHYVLSESLHNEPYEVGDHSSAVSERGSVRMVSPGPGVTGGSVNAWMEHIDIQYYFIVVPLRLSPQ